ncbi:MAG: hypothetical protein Q9159_004706 [Coniocarpon cinnabarinum]
MNADLEEEIGSINAIYGTEVLTRLTDSTIILDVPDAPVKLRVNVPSTYPLTSPIIDRPETSGTDLKRGQASAFAHKSHKILTSTFRAGEPCMFTFIDELKDVLSAEAETNAHHTNAHCATEVETADKQQESVYAAQHAIESEASGPAWTISEVVTEKKSVFIARAAYVLKPSEAKTNVQHLLSHDKRAAKATHNITAWRMKDDETGVVYRDCDDDGEDAAGSRLLHLLELMDVWNVMLVVSRWYGGIHLGPDRFRIINSVARDAILQARLVGESTQRENSCVTKKR